MRMLLLMVVVRVWGALCLSAGTLAWTGTDTTGLAFQDDEPTAKSHASLLLLSQSPPVSDLSVCLWLKLYHFAQTTSYVFSYATSDKDNNELNFAITHLRMFIAVGGSYLSGRVPDQTYVPDEWYHACVVLNSTAGMATFFLNGTPLTNVRVSRRSILVNGSLVLGQETDQISGGYNAEQSFAGVITAFNLYSRALSPEEVGVMASCGGGGGGTVEEGDLVGWKTANWVLEGPVREEQLSSDYCVLDKFRFVLIPKKRTNKASSEFCHKLKSHIAIPHNSEENTALYSAAEPFVDQCQPPNHSSAFLKLGASGTASNNTWVDQQGASLNYTNFWSISDKSYRRCVGYLKPPYRNQWIDMSCSNRLNICSACQAKRPTVFKMRGLCIHGTETILFWLDTSGGGEMPVFKGFIQYLISQENNSSWTLSDRWRGHTLATTPTNPLDLPLGRRTWTVQTDFAICGKSEGDDHELSLSACYENEYTCDDGTCISLSQRCDLRVDCPDNTDETGCDKLMKPSDYMDTLPPPGLFPGPLAMNLSVSVHGFSQVDIRNSKLTVDFSTVITWYDQRLEYQNLKPFSDLNYIDEKEVWLPKVELVNADFPDVHKTEPILTVVRMSEPEPDDSSRSVHDELYKGSKNPLQLRQNLYAPFSCPMDLHDFPFDSQHCHLKLRLSSARREFLAWQHLDVQYLGEVLLTEYEVRPLEGYIEIADDYSQAIITLNFQRRYSYYLTSTYLPTIMLMLISYASLFVSRENRDLRVMMALTTLLVLYSLYQQISEGLPRTSYVKAIDAWCFFAITFIFSQTVYHVAIDVPVMCLLCLSTTSYNVKQVNNQRSGGYMLTVARIFYAFILIIFCGLYWGILLT